MLAPHRMRSGMTGVHSFECLAKCTCEAVCPRTFLFVVSFLVTGSILLVVTSLFRFSVSS